VCEGDGAAAGGPLPVGAGAGAGRGALAGRRAGVGVPEPPAERARRWVRRHARLATGAAAALAIGLAATGVVAWQREQAREAIAAKRPKRRGSATWPASRSGGRGRVGHDGFVGDGRASRVAEGVDRRAAGVLGKGARLLQGVRAEAATEDAGRTLTATAHFRIGHLLQSLGQHAEAEAAYRTATAALERLAADHPGVPLHRGNLARCHNNLGALLSDLDQRAKAEVAEQRAALDLRKRLAADHPAVAEYRRELALSHNNLGLLFRQMRRWTEAEAEHRAALAEYDRLAAEQPDVQQHRRDVATVVTAWDSYSGRRIGPRRRRRSGGPPRRCTIAWPATTPTSPSTATTWP